MGEQRRHFQPKAESHRREGLRKLQTSLLGSEIREIAKRKICQVPTNGTVYRDILKETSTTARRNKEGPADLVTLRRQMIKIDLHRRVCIPEPQSKTVAMAYTTEDVLPAETKRGRGDDDRQAAANQHQTRRDLKHIANASTCLTCTVGPEIPLSRNTSRSAKGAETIRDDGSPARSFSRSLRCAATNAVHEKGLVEEERTTALSSVMGLAGQEVGR
ncbi:unnamed protein product [Sphagnum compactum]